MNAREGQDFGGAHPRRDAQAAQHPQRVRDRAPESRQEYAERLARRQSRHHRRPEDRRGALHRHARRRTGALHQHQVHVRHCQCLTLIPHAMRRVYAPGPFYKSSVSVYLEFEIHSTVQKFLCWSGHLHSNCIKLCYGSAAHACPNA